MPKAGVLFRPHAVIVGGYAKKDQGLRRGADVVDSARWGRAGARSPSCLPRVSGIIAAVRLKVPARPLARAQAPFPDRVSVRAMCVAIGLLWIKRLPRSSGCHVLADFGLKPFRSVEVLSQPSHGPEPCA